LFLGLDGDGHAHVGKVLLQGDDVLVEQADAALAGTARHGVLIIRAAVDTDALVTGCSQTQKPVAIGQNVASAVMEVMLPCRGVLDHRDFERFARGGLRRAHIASFHLVALVLAHAARELGHHDGIASWILVIHAQGLVALGNDDECRAGGLCWHGELSLQRCGAVGYLGGCGLTA